MFKTKIAQMVVSSFLMTTLSGQPLYLDERVVALRAGVAKELLNPSTPARLWAEPMQAKYSGKPHTSEHNMRTLSAGDAENGLRVEALAAQRKSTASEKRAEFSDPPTDGEIRASGFLPVPLVPVGAQTDVEQNRALVSALQEYGRSTYPD